MTETRGGLPILAFVDGPAFAAWIAAQPPGAAGLWLKLAKKGSATAGISRAEAIDVALCHGWIDGQLNKYDADNWLIRFTPRRRASQWSEVNAKRANALVAEGRMTQQGQAEIDAAKADGRWEAAYAPASTAEVPPDLQAALGASPSAAAFFATLKGASRYAILYRVGAAKKAETRARKITEFVAMLERGETIHG